MMSNICGVTKVRRPDGTEDGIDARLVKVRRPDGTRMGLTGLLLKAASRWDGEVVVQIMFHQEIGV